MPYITYTRGERHSRSGFSGGFAHALMRRDGFSRAYHFGQTGDVAAEKVTFTHEVTGDDADLFREMLADGRLDRAEFHLADEPPAAYAREMRRRAEEAGATPATATSGTASSATAPAARRP